MAFSKLKKLTKEQSKIRVAEDIEISKKAETHLLEHLQKRAEFGNEMRDPLIERYRSIDKQVAAYLRLDDDDTKREQDNELGKGPKPVDMIIPLTLTQLDEAVTYLLSVMAPEEAIYTAQAAKDAQDVAKGFATLMNQHAEEFGHYRNFARGFLDMVKYNMGGFITEWEERRGARIANTETGLTLKIEDDVVLAAGNEVTAFDPYNTILDPSVDPVDLSTQGEFFTTVEAHTKFRLERMERTGELFSVSRALGNVAPELKYYKERPAIRASKKGSNVTNWVSVLSAGTKELSNAYELLTWRIWIKPSDFELTKPATKKEIEEEKYQIWRIYTIGTNAVVGAERLINAHGRLPISIGMPWEDGFKEQTKSFAEHLMPLQRFASFQINVHQRASRKALYGLTIYNKLLLPLMENADVLGGKVPASPTTQDFDIRKAVAQFNDAPDTQNTLRDIDAMDTIMQKVLPTDILKQVAGLERATQYQAAATVQGANRRNLKMAKLINIQCMTGCRAIQHYNILQFQEAMSILDQAGNEIEINPADFRDANLKFTISDGLKGLDKLLIIESIKDVISWLLQNQQAAERYDIAAIIDYWTSMLGDHTDFKQFQFENEFDRLSVEEKDVAFQLFQQALQAQEEGTAQ